MSITQNPDNSVQTGFARLGGLSWTYYDIAEEAYESFLFDEKNRLPKPGKDENPTASMEQESRMRVAGVKTVVFSAMCLEAAAFDFAATHLGDTYSEQYLDKLDLVSKWVVVPKLVCGRSLKEDRAALNALRILVRSRNALVHHKSLPFDFGEKNLTTIFKAEEEFPSKVHNAFKAVVLLSLEINELLGVFATGLPIFEKHVTSSRIRPAHVKQVIERCRVIHGRSNSSIERTSANEPGDASHVKR